MLANWKNKNVLAIDQLAGTKFSINTLHGSKKTAIEATKQAAIEATKQAAIEAAKQAALEAAESTVLSSLLGGSLTLGGGLLIQTGLSLFSTWASSDWISKEYISSGNALSGNSPSNLNNANRETPSPALKINDAFCKELEKSFLKSEKEFLGFSEN